MGGGSAAFSMAFIRAKKDIRATVFELPNVVPITQEYVEKEGFVGKIDTYAGNYYTEKPTPSWTSYPNYQNLKLIEGEHYVTLSETRLNTEQNSFLVSIDLRC